MKAAFKSYLKSNGYTTKTINTRLIMIGIYLSWLARENQEVEAVRYNDLLLFMKHCQQTGRSQRTIQHYIGVVKLFYQHLIAAGSLAINPAADIQIKGVKRKTLYRIYKPEELNHIYNSYQQDSPEGSRDKSMLGLFCYQGVKSEELAKLEVQNIDLRKGTVEIPGGRKSNHRTMRLESHQVLDLYDYLLQSRNSLLAMPTTGKAKAAPTTKKLFIGSGGSHSSFNNYTSRLMRQLRALHPELVNAKQLRASVITKWLKAHNLREAQYMAGHRYVSTTESYQENDVEELSKEVQRYHPLS